MDQRLRAYWREVRKEAWHGDPFDRAHSICGAVLFLLVVWWAFGRERAIEELSATLAASAAAVLVAVVFTGLRLARAAYRIHNANLRHISDLENQRDETLEKLKRLADDRAPRVFLEFVGNKLFGTQPNQVPECPLRVTNEGRSIALEIQIDQLDLVDDLWVTFERIQQLAPGKTVNAVVEVTERSEDGGYLIDHPNHLAWAIQRAHVHKIFEGKNHKSRLWPMHVVFRDADGVSFESVYVLRLDPDGMNARIEFERYGSIKL